MTPVVLWLLIANVGMFVLRMQAPHLMGALMFAPAYTLHQPWSIVTYMFLHADTGHIFFNMLSLFFFGTRVEHRLGSSRFLQLYLWSGVAGALLSLVFAYLPLPIPVSDPRIPIVGASGAVFGVMFAFAYYWPGDRVLLMGIIPVEARVLVTIMTLFAVFGGFTGAQAGIAHFAHLGGFVGGWLYLKIMERRTGARQFRKKAEPKIAEGALVNWQKIDPLTVHEANRGELVRILDKANRSGLASLSVQERAFLRNFLPRDAPAG